LSRPAAPGRIRLRSAAQLRHVCGTLPLYQSRPAPATQLKRAKWADRSGERSSDSQTHYVILVEVQMLGEFEDVLNSFLHIRNADVYATGSNPKFLSSDVITEFRRRGDEIRVHPLSFREYAPAYEGTTDEAWDDRLPH
jgi:predicted AAA+ superfamily ATPase